MVIVDMLPLPKTSGFTAIVTEPPRGRKAGERDRSLHLNCRTQVVDYESMWHRLDTEPSGRSPADMESLPIRAEIKIRVPATWPVRAEGYS
jgi:hypothetical protein